MSTPLILAQVGLTHLENAVLEEAKIALATLCQRWRAAAKSEAEIIPRITLKVKGGMPMMLERRR